MKQSVRLIQDALFADAFFYVVLVGQYIYYGLVATGFLDSQALIIFIVGFLFVLSLVGGKYYRLKPVARANVFILLVNFALSVYIAIFFNGPFVIPLFIFACLMVSLNTAGMILNMRALISRSFGVDFFLPTTWQRHRQRNLVKFGGILAIIGFLGIASVYSFWVPYSVRAADGMRSRSSYWGSPNFNISTHNCAVTPVDNLTIQVANTTMDANYLAPGYRNGTLAYVLNVSIRGASHNYFNYTAGARSYPNGTLFLGENLTQLNEVNVTFAYVTNSIVLDALNIGASMLILNFGADFSYSDEVFAQIQQNYMFQILEYWNISYYLNIGPNAGGGVFTNVYNYLDVVPKAYEAITWGQQWPHFLGISFDFEGGGPEVPGQHPGRPPLFPGSLLPTNSNIWESWYNVNEENATLLNDAWVAYEGFYAYAEFLGLKVYNVIGGEFRDGFDGDQDVSRLPILPPSSKPNLFFGMMSYQDNNFATGRYQLYKDCVQQINFFGDRGRTILTGWIADGTKYYTDDDIGFQRYVNDVLLAQAAGMTEVVHAPIYRLQAKWGDDHILALYEALNTEPKKNINFYAPVLDLDRSFVEDYVKNFNRPTLFALMMITIIGGIFLFGPYQWHLEIRAYVEYRKKTTSETRPVP